MKSAAFPVIALTLMILLSAGTASAASSLAVNATAALGGTNFGLEVTTMTGSDAYVQDDSPNNEKTYTVRFRMRVPATFSIPMGSNVRILRTNDTLGQNMILFLLRDVVDTYRLAVWANDDGLVWRNVGSGIFLDFPATPVDRQIELTYAAATAPGMNNGAVTLTKLGTAQTTSRTNLDTDTREINRVRIGVFDNTASSGPWHFDEFESFR